MQRVYHRWHSPALGRNMELLVFGHAGAPCLVFPTSRGRFFEYEDRQMVAALAPQIEQGGLQLICLDSVDEESWYNYTGGTDLRLWRHDQYEHYIITEVLPLVRAQNQTPYLITHGCSFGATHALLFGLRHPDLVDRILALSGLFDLRGFFSHYTDALYFHNPVDFTENLSDQRILQRLRQIDIIMAIGRDDQAAWSNQRLSQQLWRKGVGNALRLWDGWAHDWPYWQRMVTMYIGGHD